MAVSGGEERERVVVTGVGAVSPLGNDVSSTWAGMMDGHCGVRAISRFDASDYPCTLAAPAGDFDPLEYVDRRDARRMSRFVQFAVAAAAQAVADSGLDLSGEDRARVGVEIGSAFGGTAVVEEQCQVLMESGPRRVSPTTVPAMLVSMPACFVAIQQGILGPVGSPVAACATGVVAIGEAMRRLARGGADVILAGGAENPVTPVIISAFGRMGGLSRRNDTPARAITPFDADRDGTVLGEGAGVLVLESLAHALARKARILAEVTGYALTCDAHHISAPLEDGSGAARAMSGALADAGVEPAAVDYVAAHGTGTPLNDAMETRAIKTALGEGARRVAVSSIKSMTGHTVAAAGALSAIAAIKAMHERVVPPTIGLQSPDPECDLDYVPNEPREAEIRVALVNGFGFGGQNASILLERWSDD
jgi:3-oxoacyl-[acyl-carrier-protein] synthase II